MKQVEIDFDWDPEKSDDNWRRRGFDFEFAALIFGSTYVEFDDAPDGTTVTVIGRGKLPRGEWTVGKKNPYTLSCGRQFINLTGLKVPWPKSYSQITNMEMEFKRMYKARNEPNKKVESVAPRPARIVGQVA